VNGAKPQLPLYDFMRAREQLHLLRFRISWTLWRLLEMRDQMSAFCTDVRLENGLNNCSSLCTSCIVIEFKKKPFV
jgi:hypothetical protein